MPAARKAAYALLPLSNLLSLPQKAPPAASTPEKDGVRQYFLNGLSSDSTIALPLTADFSDPDIILSADGFRVTLNGDNGWHWQSAWINRSIKLTADSPCAQLEINMPYESLDSLSRVHPQATVELAYTLYHLEPSQRIATAANHFTLPGGLECRWPSGRRELFFRIASECSAPLRLPGVLVARIESADSTCPPEQGEPPVPAGLSAKYIHYGSDTSLADFDPSPVRDSNLDFFDWSPPTPSARNPKELRHVEFCRGTPLTIRTGQYQSWFDLGPLGEAHQATIQYDPYRVLPDDKTPAPRP